ncbi:MAG TPA: hypothetical protein VFQ44_09705 [Streptosporangiaceae bacterium]|nr:hypothetical protein [Streptosporangiaceae bacterium]
MADAAFASAAAWSRASPATAHWSEFAADTYRLPLDRPDLIPNAIIPSFATDLFQHYEAFVIDEGWREEATINGPFLVAQDRIPIVEFDEYDEATIGLYE